MKFTLQSKKIFQMALCGSLLLVGCQSKDMSLMTGTITPVPSLTEKSNLFREIAPDDLETVLESLYGSYAFNSVDLLDVLGSEMPEFTFADMNGKKITKETFKNKKVVFEVVSDTCNYCKTETSMYMDDIKKTNPDTVFVQLFASGETESVKAFYKEINKEFNVDYVVANSTAVDTFINSLNVDSFPTFIFFDEASKLCFTAAGMVDVNGYSELSSVAYGEKKIYELYNKDEVDFSPIKRDYEDVKNDLSQAGKDLIKTLNLDAEIGDKTLYSNLGKSWGKGTLTDIYGKKLEFDALNGREFVFEFLTTNEDVYSGSITSAQRASTLGNDSVVHIQFWMPYTEEEVEDVDAYVKNYLETNDIKNGADYTFAFKEPYPSVFDDLYVYDYPTQFFIDRNFKIAGVSTGTLSKEKYTVLKDVFFGDVPLYEMKAIESKVKVENKTE